MTEKITLAPTGGFDHVPPCAACGGNEATGLYWLNTWLCSTCGCLWVESEEAKAAAFMTTTIWKAEFAKEKKPPPLGIGNKDWELAFTAWLKQAKKAVAA